MKRAKESGAVYRKKRKAREEVLNKNKGALFKYISRIETKSLSNSRDSSSTSSDSSTSTPSSDEEHEEENIPGPAVDRVDIKDVGLWPSKISNDTLIFLVAYVKVRLWFKI
ncbi:hypothetical protein Hamer_G027168 [Homarus americanus]|uniref:Uncharacterized protein n=1 Tax=Homarus americanus TaxID=6706 RepID=A0A8J5JFD4_HOMAM|nr:hypothetical protein Hamer_G027168 [Homarus americanus]